MPIDLLSPVVISPADNTLMARLRGYLRDLSPDPDVGARYLTGAWAINREVIIPEEIKPLPYTVFITLCKLAGYGYFGREEKVAWAIPVTYKGVPFLLAHRKSGFKVSSTGSPDRSDELATEMIGQLNRAIGIADRLMEEEIKGRVRAGKVTVINKYHVLREMYRFFRGKADASFAAAATREGFYYAVAMLDAFFSLLEHVLILLLPSTLR